MRGAIITLMIAAIGATLALIGYQALETELHPKEQTFEFVNCGPHGTLEPPINYLEYKVDGTVWARWPDGRFLEVIPK